MQTRQTVDCPPRTVLGFTLTQETVYKDDPERKLYIGDRVSFTCNGRGRGGHYMVTVDVTKINRKTFDAIEAPRSYRPGTKWKVSLDIEGLTLELPYVSTKDAK